MTDQARTALVAGATGEVGRALVRRLAAHPAYANVVVLARRAAPAAPPGVTWRVIDFDALEGSVTDLEVDDVFCTLGTTMKQAGSKDAFRKVERHLLDHEGTRYPPAVVNALIQQRRASGADASAALAG